MHRLVYIKNRPSPRQRHHLRAIPSLRCSLLHNPEIIDLFDDVMIARRFDDNENLSLILDSTIDHFGLMMDYDLNHPCSWSPR